MDILDGIGVSKLLGNYHIEVNYSFNIASHYTRIKFKISLYHLNTKVVGFKCRFALRLILCLRRILLNCMYKSSGTRCISLHYKLSSENLQAGTVVKEPTNEILDPNCLYD